jgi:hypothetical protein
MKTTYLTAFAFLSLTACSASTTPVPAPTPSATGTTSASLTPATPACPDIATSCNAGCIEAKARTYDPAAKCSSKSFDVVVGCNAPELRPDNVICGIRRADGTVLIGSAAVVLQGGDLCSDEMRKTATEAPFCP